MMNRMKYTKIRYGHESYDIQLRRISFQMFQTQTHTQTHILMNYGHVKQYLNSNCNQNIQYSNR